MAKPSSSIAPRSWRTSPLFGPRLAILDQGLAHGQLTVARRRLLQRVQAPDGRLEVGPGLGEQSLLDSP
jgi:hypothetical protein